MNTCLKKFMLLTISMIPITLFSQSPEIGKINVGFGAGVSINNVFNHISNAQFESKFSPVLITVNAQMQLGEKWGVFSEMDYIHKGPQDYDIRYFVFSVLLQYEIFNKPEISLMVGPYIGYLIRYESYGLIVDHEFLKNYDTGIDAGISLSKSINKKINLFVSPRIEVGMRRFSYSNHISYQLKTGIRFK